MANNIPNKNAFLHRDNAWASLPALCLPERVPHRGPVQPWPQWRQWRCELRGTAGRSLLLFVRRISQHCPLAMPDYHLHEVKRDGSIAKRSIVLKCRDDDEAIRQAWQLQEGRGVEVWQEGRLVVQLPRDPR